MKLGSFQISLLLVFALISVSTSSIFVRMLPLLPAVVIAFWRMSTASVFLWSYSVIKSQGKIQKTSYTKLILAGVFLGLHFACFFGAVKLTTVANATLFGTTAPFFTVLIEKAFFKRNIQRKVVLGLVLATFGGIMIHGGHFHFSDQHTQGNLLALIGSLWLAIVWILAESVRKTTKTIVFSRSVYMVAGFTLFVVSIFMHQSVINFTVQDVPWFLALGLVPTIFGHTIFSYVVKFVSPTVVASVPLGEPILASFFAWLLFAESVPASTMIGGGFTLAGLYLITVRFSSSRFQSENL